MYYSSGIYEPTDTSNSVGLHSVRLIGWGEELDSNGTAQKYWTAANSWGRVSFTLWHCELKLLSLSRGAKMAISELRMEQLVSILCPLIMCL